LVGNAVELSRDGLGYLHQCALKYGDLVPLRYFWKPVLFVNRPDLIEQVITVNQHRVVKDVGQRADRPLIGNGLFLSEGQTWLRQRRMMQPAFHRERIAAYGDDMVALTRRMLESWTGGETRDVYQDMSHLTMAIVAKTLFGADVWRDAEEVASALALALNCLQARVRTLQILLPDTLPTPTNLRLRHARRRIDRVVYRVIAQRRAAGDSQADDLLSMLLNARDEAGTSMTDTQVRDEVMTILVGGYETAADALSWVWYLLSQHLAAQSKLHRELDTALAGRAPTVADLPRLPYTGTVVAEALRLYPPAPALGREVIAEFDLDGHRVPKGTDVLVSQWVMHRDPRYFADPDEFNPDRWTDGLAERIPRFAYFPFGGGPRLCIGNSFATMEMTLILATVAQRFRLSLAPGHPVVPEMIPTLRPKHGMRMVLGARSATTPPPTRGDHDKQPVCAA